jgi:hypothetical protein
MHTQGSRLFHFPAEEIDETYPPRRPLVLALIEQKPGSSHDCVPSQKAAHSKLGVLRVGSFKRFFSVRRYLMRAPSLLPTTETWSIPGRNYRSAL